MNYKLFLIILILITSCKKNDTFSQSSNLGKEYVYDFQKDSSTNEDFSGDFGKPEFELEKILKQISKVQYDKDSISYKNDIALKENLLKNNGKLELSYGNVAFVSNNNKKSDNYIDYSYQGFSNSLNSHIIHISLYEGGVILLLKNDRYDYMVLDNYPIISFNKKKLATYKDNEGLSSSLVIYNIHDNFIKFEKYFWSENNIIINCFWNKENKIILKLKNIENNNINYYEIDNKIEKLTDFINADFLNKNQSTPEVITDHLIFTKNKNGSLQINTQILDYISKTTTRENSNYLKALEEYAYNRNEKSWSIDEFAKIKAYIFNTSYPLRKEYWANEYEKWYNGKPEEFLGAGSIWRNNNYYDLPKLKDYVYDFREKLGI